MADALTKAPKQFDLPLSQEAHRFQLSNYFAYSNRQKQLISTLSTCITSQQAVLLQGPSASGKTHLLHACSRLAPQALLLSGKEPHTFSPHVLRKPPPNTLFFIDDLDALFPSPTWERAFFSLLTQYPIANQSPIIATVSSVQALNNIKLQDLTSRLRTFLCIETIALDLNQQYDALIARARSLGLTLKKRHIDWLIRLHPRDNHFLFETLHKLEKLCITHQLQPSLYLLKKAITYTL